MNNVPTGCFEFAQGSSLPGTIASGIHYPFHFSQYNREWKQRFEGDNHSDDNLILTTRA
jgi:hypothetical protein